MLTNNYLKHQWVKCSNQKTEIRQMDAKTRPIYMLSTRDPPQTQGHIQTESEWLEKRYFMKMETKRKQE